MACHAAGARRGRASRAPAAAGGAVPLAGGAGGLLCSPAARLPAPSSLLPWPRAAFASLKTRIGAGEGGSLALTATPVFDAGVWGLGSRLCLRPTASVRPLQLPPSSRPLPYSIPSPTSPFPSSFPPPSPLPSLSPSQYLALPSHSPTHPPTPSRLSIESSRLRGRAGQPQQQREEEQQLSVAEILRELRQWKVRRSSRARTRTRTHQVRLVTMDV